jgi:hypothetical protein
VFDQRPDNPNEAASSTSLLYGQFPAKIVAHLVFWHVIVPFFFRTHRTTLYFWMWIERRVVALFPLFFPNYYTHFSPAYFGLAGLVCCGHDKNHEERRQLEIKRRKTN